MTDPEISTAWAIAVPSVLSAVSTFYIRHFTKKSVSNSDTNTASAVNKAAEDTSKEIDSLRIRVSRLEIKVEESRKNQFKFFQEQADSISAIHQILTSKEKTIAPPTSAIPPDDVGEVKSVEEPVQPFGKVIVKP